MDDTHLAKCEDTCQKLIVYNVITKIVLNYHCCGSFKNNCSSFHKDFKYKGMYYIILKKCYEKMKKKCYEKMKKK